MVFPARAGVILSKQSIETLFPGLSRTSGGDPKQLEGDGYGTQSFPHERG